MKFHGTISGSCSGLFRGTGVPPVLVALRFTSGGFYTFHAATPPRRATGMLKQAVHMARILIVDDQEMMRDSLAATLGARGTKWLPPAMDRRRLRGSARAGGSICSYPI